MPVLVLPEVPKTLSPEEELRKLEEEAISLGMSPAELAKIQALGCCSSQIRTRIELLRSWIANYAQR
jgi:hypothetical protein